jgi:hypothetical protein
MADTDVREMFLNFVLHLSVRVYAGVDFTAYFPWEGGAKVWETWQRAAMGLQSLPYQACQAMGFVEEIIQVHEKM